MKKINMNYNGLKELLETCNIDELDSLDLLLDYVKNYDLELINKVFKEVYQKKCDEHSSDFEGMNEYDKITRIQNFDITRIPEYTIYQYELICLKKIMNDAILNITENNNSLDLKLVSNIEQTLEKINSCLNNYNDLSYVITEEELEDIFNKFNPIEIEELSRIFGYIEEYNVERLLEIAENVCNKQIEKTSEYFECFVKPYNFDVIDLCEKKNVLSKKELEFLQLILEKSIMGLIDYENECAEEEYERLEKLKVSLLNLQESFSEELDNRNNVKTYTYN